MAVTTIEDALQARGQELVKPALTQQIRKALSQGEGIEVVILFRPAKQGPVCSMETRHCDVTKYPTFIRLK